MSTCHYRSHLLVRAADVVVVVVVVVVVAPQYQK
jgi:hypothetical protein